MTRGDARELAVHLLYSLQFQQEEPRELVSARLDRAYYSCLSEENTVYTSRPSASQTAYIERVVEGVACQAERLDQTISELSVGWDISRISKLTRCILQLAIFEILYMEDVPTGVAINEAVRLAKRYDGDDTGAFVNGVLGTFARNLPAEEKS